MRKLKDLSPITISLAQSTLLIVYIFLISQIFIYGNQLFGPTVNILGPMIFLMLFIISAIISATVTFGYPAWLFFVDKKYQEALKIAVLTTGWLIIFFFSFLIMMLKR